MKRILIIEDDEKLNNAIKLALRKEYFCVQAHSLQDARTEWQVQQFDLVLLDVNLPDGNGVDYLMEIRKKSVLPVILITANNMEMDIVTGLELGANDYITKPFSLMILRARVGVWLREKENDMDVYKSGDLHFDFNKMEFWMGNGFLELSKTEQRLLRCLIENKGVTVSRSQLIDKIWSGDSEYVDEHALTVVMNRLRSKLGENADNSECIKTIYGVGYTWTKI